MSRKSRPALSISDGAVSKATGKKWSEWFAILDKARAKKMNHKEIVAVLSREHQVGSWWRQMVTLIYEQARGLREKHQVADGYRIGGSKTVNVPLGRLFKAWRDERQRRRWLADPSFTIRKATPNKSMRITWVDGKTNLDVNFYAKGEGRSTVQLDHIRLASATEVERRKAYWTAQLAKLREVLEQRT